MSDVRFAELIARTAHDLRSPLTSIKGFSATLAGNWERFTDDQRRRFVETIHSDADRMSRIISEVVDLARLEAGGLQLDLIEVSVRALARRARDEVGRTQDVSRVEIVAPADDSAVADPDRLVNVLVCLIENAVTLSDSGPVLVRLSRKDGETLISVRDSGPGIEPERVAGIFDGPAAPDGAGSFKAGGLGLYIARRLVEAHGGRIWVESVPAAGTTFTIALPGRIGD